MVGQPGPNLAPENRSGRRVVDFAGAGLLPAIGMDDGAAGVISREKIVVELRPGL